MNITQLKHLNAQQLADLVGPESPEFLIEKKRASPEGRWMVRLHPEAAGPRIEVRTPRGSWSDDVASTPRALRRMLAAHQDKKGVWRSKKPFSTWKSLVRETADIVVRFVRRMLVLIVSLPSEKAKHIIRAVRDTGVGRVIAEIDLITASRQDGAEFWRWCLQENEKGPA